MPATPIATHDPVMTPTATLTEPVNGVAPAVADSRRKTVVEYDALIAQKETELKALRIERTGQARFDKQLEKAKALIASTVGK